ncbi:MAG TPA: DJ-1/PfpI family protein [Nocardia sp.]|uniref:DJ-1/PfpI family protein n=1 Tax=Nocardia sp. TaxID=1821 RepID=UPI002B4B0439|nr:DJ-1/PfpI family protein [Nocardia sp.]HLS77953.1 DJ-1/PfpI family protein [Nocardia sp.]
MSPTPVYAAVYDSLADWETGAATAHVNDPSGQREPGRYQVVTVGPARATITTKGGARITPDLALDELDPAAGALLILPGADAWVTGELTPFAETAARFVAAGTPVAAICGATFGLATAGLLDTRRHTSNAPEFLAHSGYTGAANYVAAPAVTAEDRLVVTASGTAPFEFAREVFGVLDLYEPHILDAWYRVFAHQDPEAYAVLEAYEAARA